MPLTPAQLSTLADQLCDLVREMTTHRQGGGPHWIMVETLARELRRHGIAADHDDLQAAIAMCVARHVLKAEGEPPHSISPWQKGWKIDASKLRGRR